MANIILITGIPGAGKGVLSDKIINKFPNVIHLSVGDLVRAEKKLNTQNAKIINEVIDLEKKGGKELLIPNDVIIDILKNEINKNSTAYYIIDGFPREIEQYKIFSEKIGEPKLTIILECDEKIILDRIINRGKIGDRDGDNIDFFNKRIKTYHEDTLPIINMLINNNKNIYKFNTNNMIDTIFETDILPILNKYII